MPLTSIEASKLGGKSGGKTTKSPKVKPPAKKKPSKKK